jgi:NADPH:quinone reductase-like Zn-dependent oxidoreductase
MQAALCTAHGGPDSVVLREVGKPVTGPDDVLIRIHATTVSSGDARVRAARFPSGFGLLARLALGISGPRQPILGVECAGVIEAVGDRVTAFVPGDVVFAAPGAGFGCHAEYRSMPASGAVARIPANFSFEEAAAIAFGGGTALHFLTGAGQLKSGESLLVIGGSGAVGSAAVQIGKHLGAHVTAVCSGANAPLVTALGADAVIDYRTQDFMASGMRWDVILDTVGDATAGSCRSLLNKGGRLLLIVAGLGQMLAAPIQSMFGGVKIAAGPAPDNAENLLRLKDICEEGGFRPVIDSRFALGAIADAHRRVDTGRKTGSVVVRMREVS